jgi:hypothetical protein
MRLENREHDASVAAQPPWKKHGLLRPEVRLDLDQNSGGKLLIGGGGTRKRALPQS